MLRNLMLAFLLLLGMGAATGFAMEEIEEDAQIDAQIEDSYDGALEPSAVPGINGHESRRFLGCVHDDDHHHECEHLADNYGYHHSDAAYDHHRCRRHDHNYACYGWN